MFGRRWKPSGQVQPGRPDDESTRHELSHCKVEHVVMRLVASSGSGGEGARPSGAAVAARQQAMSVAVSRVMGEREEGEEDGGGSRGWLEEEERSLAPLIR